MKKRIIPGTQTLEFTFTDLPAYQFDSSTVHDEIKYQALPRVFLHRLGDCAANMKTEAERRAAVVALGEHYLSGSQDWNVRSTAPKINPVIVRLAARLGITYEEANVRDVDEMLDDITKL